MTKPERYRIPLWRLDTRIQKYAHSALGTVEIVKASDYDELKAKYELERAAHDAMRKLFAEAKEQLSRLEHTATVFLPNDYDHPPFFEQGDNTRINKLKRGTKLYVLKDKT